MKIKLSTLKRVIKEAVASSELPKEGDTYVEYDDEEGAHYADVYAGGDLATATDEDIDYSQNGGPDAGQPGTWLALDWGTNTFGPGNLVKIPGSSPSWPEWTMKINLEKILAAKDKNTPKTPTEKAMIKLLSNVTTYHVGMNDVKDYRIRLRKESIYFTHDPDGNRGIEGTIRTDDLTGVLKRGGLPAVAAWMLEHGAKKMKPAKRGSRMRSMPYYD